jgi:O-antigen/teichoic acid export membrane protein
MIRMGNVDSTSPVLEASDNTKTRGVRQTFSRNVVYSLARVVANSLVGLVLPAYLTHHLSVKIYGAWALILQLSAYVSYLDFGVQTAISKYVAEYEARGDTEGARLRASAGFSVMLAASIMGVLLTLVLAWRVPYLFRDMPASLYKDVQIGLTLVGISQAIVLASSVFSAIFLGLQKYSVPMGISIINRLLFTLVVCSTVFFRGSLAVMGIGAALVNTSTSILQIAAWRKWAGQIRVSIFNGSRIVLKEVLGYCGILAIWQAGMLCVSGLDVTIVGHYDFAETAYYSVATLPTNLILLISVSILGPLMPATSAISTQRGPLEMGNILIRTTRYSTILLLLTSLPLIVCGFFILRYWVGTAYASHTILYLRVLVFANVLRNICLPYATMVVATGKQKLATLAALSEAIVNVASSILLASHFGAIGVALGTLLGAFVSIAMHFSLSMHNTRTTLTISRARLFLDGVARPSIIAIPSILLFPLWRSSTSLLLSPQMCTVWLCSTLLIAWLLGLSLDERNRLIQLVKRSIAPSKSMIG